MKKREARKERVKERKNISKNKHNEKSIAASSCFLSLLVTLSLSSRLIHTQNPSKHMSSPVIRRNRFAITKPSQVHLPCIIFVPHTIFLFCFSTRQMASTLTVSVRSRRFHCPYPHPFFDIHRILRLVCRSVGGHGNQAKLNRKRKRYWDSVGLFPMHCFQHRQAQTNTHTHSLKIPQTTLPHVKKPNS